eukprot:1954488-Rhodomonas_salina.1
MRRAFQIHCCRQFDFAFLADPLLSTAGLIAYNFIAYNFIAIDRLRFLASDFGVYRSRFHARGTSLRTLSVMRAHPEARTAASEAHRGVLAGRKRVEDLALQKLGHRRMLLPHGEGMRERGGRERHVEGQPRHAAEYSLVLKRGERKQVVCQRMPLHAIR